MAKSNEKEIELLLQQVAEGKLGAAEAQRKIKMLQPVAVKKVVEIESSGGCQY